MFCYVIVFGSARVRMLSHTHVHRLSHTRVNFLSHPHVHKLSHARVLRFGPSRVLLFVPACHALPRAWRLLLFEYYLFAPHVETWIILSFRCTRLLPALRRSFTQASSSLLLVILIRDRSIFTGFHSLSADFVFVSFQAVPCYTWICVPFTLSHLPSLELILLR